MPEFLSSDKLFSDPRLHEFKEPFPLSMCLHTHSAIRPPRDDFLEEDKDSRRCPGITLRDVRFAMLFDEAWSNEGSFRTQVEERIANCGVEKYAMNQPTEISDLISGSKHADKAVIAS